MKLLRQSTPGQIIKFGPMVDTAGAAATGLSLIQTDLILCKPSSTTYGSTTFAAKNDSSGGTHRNGGMYTTTLDATDTGDCGILSLNINKTGALPFSTTWEVVPSWVYDALVAGGTNRLPVDLTKLNGDTTNALKLAESVSTIVLGTSDNTGFTATTTIFQTDITEATPDHFKGCVISFRSGALAGQRTACTAYALVGGRGQFTVNALTEAVPNGSLFAIT